jgi:hypothetical protein
VNLFFWRRGRSLAEHLAGRPKKIRIDSVDFTIRKINLLDHAAGLNVVTQFFQVYTKTNPKVDEKLINDTAQVRKFMRDFIYAGLVEPKLHMKPLKDGEKLPLGEYHVDEILADMELSSKLFAAIYQYSIGKKKRRSIRSRARVQPN